MASALSKNSSSKDLDRELAAGVGVCALLALLLIAAGVTIAHPGEDDLEQVRAEVQWLRPQVQQLQLELGVVGTEAPQIQISHVSLPDLYFQARALSSKIGRFSFELIRLQESLPPIPRERIRDADILDLVRPAKTAMERIMRELKVSDAPPGDSIHLEATPDAMFHAMQESSHRIDALLEQPFGSSETFAQVTLAVGYAARLLSAYPHIRRIPAEPPFEGDKQPKDAYRRLIGCLHLINDIDAMAGLAPLTLDTDNLEVAAITPGDVFDLASLVVARLDSLHRQADQKPLPLTAVFPGRRFPSDVFRRAGLLEKQLQALKALMDDRALPSSKRNP